MMSADEMDETTITVVGFTGLAAAAGVFILETSTSLKEQKRRIELSESGQIVERATELEEPVEECSWVFVGVTLLFTSTYSLLYIFYAVTLEIKYTLIASLILPITVVQIVMVLLYKPKRTDAGYKRFL
eukprot:CAMPEP_0182491844 /NCGR_PEP_ID=MMETSP1321-20130603/1142_1 /TAXON_ID=91990 /ORGANISM="Bolidomonas sp., Strain RCC1657" /LENGTH=128 /DNA_ID=CAMNT_0024694181 /DNA_START=1 /DNA_END=384 /DNA_ORIENTATION=-